MPISDEIAVKLIADVEDLIAGLKQAEEQTQQSLDNIHDSTVNVGEAFSSIRSKIETAFEATGILLVYEGLREVADMALEFKAALDEAASSSVNLINESAQYGATVEELQGLRYAAEEVGLGAGTVDRALMMLSMRMQSAREVSGPLRDKLAQVGIATKDLAAPAFTAEKALVRVAESTATMSEKAEIFGRFGQRFVPLLREIAAQHGNLAAAAKALGATTTEEAEKFAAYHREATKLSIEFQNFKEHLLVEALPAVQELGKALSKLFLIITNSKDVDKAGRALTYALAESFAYLSATLASVVVDLEGLFETIRAGAGVFDSVKGKFDSMHGALTTAAGGPIKLIMDIGANVAMLGKHTDGIADRTNAKLAQIRSEYEKTIVKLEQLRKEAEKPEKKSSKKDDDPLGPPNKVAPDNVLKERLKMAQQTSLDLIKIAQETANTESKLGEITAEDKLAIDKALVQSRLDVELHYLEGMIRFSAGHKDIQEKLADDEVKAKDRARQEKLALDDKYAEEQQKLTEQRINADAEAAMQGVEAAKQLNDTDLSNHAITTEQHAAIASGLALKELGIEQTKIAALQALRSGDTANSEKLSAQLSAASAKYTKAQVEINQKAAQDIRNYWEHAAQTMASSMSNALTGMIRGTTTLKQALTQIFDDILKLFIEKMVTIPLQKWLEGEAAKIASAEISSTQHVAVQEAASAAVTGVKAGEATAVVSSNAAEGASGAAASQAAIPVVGPGLAIAAFAAIFALIMGAMKSVKSAAGGYLLPSDQMVAAHKDEVVLPAHLSKGFQEIIKRGQTGSDTPQVHIHALDGASVERVLRNNIEAFSKVVRIAAGRANKGYT